MRALKFFLYGVAGLAVFALVAAAGVALVVDGAFVKARLERSMKDKNRTLAIEGTPSLTLFPVARIALGRTTLSEPGGDRPFVALEAAEVALRVMPLLAGEIALETVKLSGLRIDLVRGGDGRMNFADLAGDKGEPGAPPKIRIAELNVQNAQIAYRDQASGRELSVVDLNLRTGRLDGEAPGPVSASARISGRKPELDLRAQAGGALRFNFARQEIGFDGFSARLKGRVDRDSLAAEISAPKVEISPARASGAAITGSLQRKGPQTGIDAKLRIASIEGSAGALWIPNAAIELAALVAGAAVKARAEVALKADLGRGTASADVAAKLDDSTIKGKLGLEKLAPLAVRFELDIDRFNVDRYAPPKKEPAKTDERIDFSALKGPSAQGGIAIGALTVRRVKLSNVKAQVKLAGGRLEVAPHSANLYGGTLSGSLGVEANGNRVTLKETVRGVQVGPLLRDAAGESRIEGRGNLSLDLAGAGASLAAVKKSLGGSARFELRDGAVKGINLAEAIQSLRPAKANDPSKKTDFSEITGSFAISNGVARNDDLQGKAPLLRLAGAGDVDIGNDAVNYTARVSLVATSKGQGGRDLSNLVGVTVPVKVSGPLARPDVSLDFGEVLAKAGGGIGRAAESAGRTLRGLFGR